MAEEPAVVVERAGCSECGSAHHQGSIVLWLKHKIHQLEHCDDREIEVAVAECARAYLTEEDAEALLGTAMCLAKPLKSAVEVNSCSGAAESVQIAVAVYVPDQQRLGKGAYRVSYADGAPQASIEMARAAAYTAFAHSSDRLAVTTRDFRRMTAPGQLWEGYDIASKSMGVGISRVDGGVPLYRNGQLVGALGIAGADTTKLHKLALDTAGECLGIPEALKKKTAELTA